MGHSLSYSSQGAAFVDVYGLIGFPLGHSFSAKYFAEKFACENIEATYENFEMEQLPDLHQWAMIQPHLRGFNVTIPHKQTIIAQLDALSPAATEIGAVNVVCIVRSAEGEVRLLGDNSDWVGFTESLRPLLRSDIQRALVLGTGGASRAVVVALRKLGIHPTYVSRYPLPQGVEVGGAVVPVLTYDALTPEVMKAHSLVINTTPLGMHPKVEEAPAIPYTLLTSAHVLYDLVYNPLETRFMQLGKAQGTVVKNGLEMLHLQAETAWEAWHTLAL